MRLVEVREPPPDPLVEEQHAGEPILKLIAIRRTRTTVNASAKGVRGLRFEAVTHPPFELKLERVIEGARIEARQRDASEVRVECRQAWWGRHCVRRRGPKGPKIAERGFGNSQPLSAAL